MVTDRPPRAKTRRAQFARSDEMSALELPSDARFRDRARAVETALASGKRTAVQRACTEFVTNVAEFYEAPAPGVRVLAARPLKVYEDGGSIELYGDYDPEANRIRVWMRTAVHKRVTAFGTLLATLCHEFCHHLDMTKLGFEDSAHTRGFYERTACLYHHARGTPYRALVWKKRTDGRFQVDWAAMNRSRRQDS